jgi:hypothetical protein
MKPLRVRLGAQTPEPATVKVDLHEVHENLGA